MAGPDVSEPGERRTAKRRVVLVVSILRNDTTAAEAARKQGLSVGEIDDWQEQFLQGAENALPSRPKDEEALKDEQIKKLKRNVRELVLNVHILREAVNGRPFAPKTSDE